ncbi:MAG TPA: excalibur calcium-binding domain-containing protein [Solirubrobacteraceae bacterium]|jgi:hypothetical protein|nr:excalibur calcium-binding domain-containing protein [Solirubrobacteraceae bacterium]
MTPDADRELRDALRPLRDVAPSDAAVERALDGATTRPGAPRRRTAPRRSALLDAAPPRRRRALGSPAHRRRPTGRGLAIALVALVAGGGVAAAAVQLTAASPRSFAVAGYLGHGDAYDCGDLSSQALAQAVLRADPRDPNRLDEQPDGITADRDGIACPELPAPTDHKPVKAIVQRFRCRPDDSRTARCPQPSRPFDPRAFLGASAFDLYDCDDFASQADAQAVLRFQPEDPEHLDGDRDGIACPGRPGPRDANRVPRPAP